jgi:large subunit ribosomal protein L22
MVTAQLNDYRQSPRKVRLVASLIKGKSADKAIAMLGVTIKEASGPIKKLIESAIANAKNNFHIDRAELYIKEVQVNPGTVMKRSMPRARGSAYPVRKRTSHISLILDQRAPESVAKLAEAPKSGVEKTVKKTKSSKN